MRELRVLALAGMVLCAAASVAFGDAHSDYTAIFGKEAARVSSSLTKADDVAFAKKLLESAASVPDSPKLQVLLCEKAFLFAATSSEGLPIAMQVLEVLEREFPARKADWQARRLGLLRSQYTRARGEAKKAAAQTYLEALLAAADALLDAGQPAQALSHYRSARSMASYYRKEIVSDIQRKITQAGNEALIAGKIKALRSRLQADPKDLRAREDLIVLYVVQQDAPDKAREIMADGVNAKLRTHVWLASRNPRKQSEDDCLRLAEWYHKTLLLKASGRGRRIVLERAQLYYERYLAQHELRDVPRLQADSALKKVQAELARLGPKTPEKTPTTRAPKDAIAFGGHHYKVIFDRSVAWHAAAKQCTTLGGHLVTIESAREMAFLRRLAGRSRLWVGATDEAAEGRWVWVNGKRMSREFRLWAPGGEPNEGRRCNYASVMAGGLADTPSPGTRVGGFICEWEQ